MNICPNYGEIFYAYIMVLLELIDNHEGGVEISDMFILAEK